MKKWFKHNIFLVSIPRQPLRAVILFLLITIAAFTFVMRTTEYFVVRDRIFDAASFYQSVGFLQISGQSYGNVVDGADIIAASPHVAFEDRRRGAEAVLHNLHNANIGGRIDSDRHVLHGMETAYIEIPERQHYAYFYITVDRVIRVDSRRTGSHMDLRVHIDDVAVGFPEHAEAGQRAQIHFPFEGEENPLTMQEGGRYFIRAALHWVSDARGIRTLLPARGQESDFLNIYPLNDQGLLYIPVPYGRADLSKPGFESIANDIERMHYNHSVVWLRTTADMESIPSMHEELDRVRLIHGRLLNHQDHLEQRPVAVIHNGFAMLRGIDVGDTITVSVPKEQQIVDLHIVAFLDGQGMDGWAYRRENLILADGMMDFAVLGNPEEFMINELELEVVGTYLKLPNSPLHVSPRGYATSLFGNYVYIPDSLLPADFMPVDNLHGYSDYVWSNWYSFVLTDARYERAFIEENHEALLALGYNLHFIPTGAEAFWTSAEPILRTTTFNVITFMIVLIMVLGLVVFMYLHQRRRDFAICHALGNSAKNTIKQMCIPLILLSLPAILSGGTFGLIFALREAAIALEFMEYAESVAPPVLILIGQFVFILCAMLIMLYVGASRTAKMPILELLQGRKNTTKSTSSTVSGRSVTLVPNDTTEGNISSGNDQKPTNDTMVNTHSVIPTRYNKLRASISFLFKHIVRAPLKTTLVLTTAILLISALGVLQWSIRNIESDIDSLYDSTVVTGELVRRGFDGTGDFVGSAFDEIVIFNHTAQILFERNIFSSYYFEATFRESFVISGEHVEDTPEFWSEFWSHIRTYYWGAADARIDPLLAFSDFYGFLEEHSGQPAEAMPGGIDASDIEFGELAIAAGDLEIDFAPNFSSSDFIYNDRTLQSPIPVILSDLLLERRGLTVGDFAYIGHYFPNMWGVSDSFVVPIQIIGSHNGSISRIGGRNSVLLPFTALELIRGDALQYSRLRFDVDPAANRELSEIRDELQAQIGRHRQTGHRALNILLHDTELRVVVNQMDRNLAFLVLLYPVAVSLSILIAAGLGLLLLIQSAKIAAILRILGYSKKYTKSMLVGEHLIVVACGLLIGFLVLPIFGIRSELSTPILALLYIFGSLVGSLLGASLITNRAPLELLQIKE